MDGLQTADPRLVPEARTIPEVSYREAAELAYFGAKVLHPKTLRAVMQCGIPLWIRNTFAPERLGTKITPAGLPSAGGVKALTAISDVAHDHVGGPALAGVQDVLGRTFRTTAAVRADVLLISQASSQNDLCLADPICAQAKARWKRCAMNLLMIWRRNRREDINARSDRCDGYGSRPEDEFGSWNRRPCLRSAGPGEVNITAIAQGSSECTLSFVVAKRDVKRRSPVSISEFRLGSPQPLLALSKVPTTCHSIPTIRSRPIRLRSAEQTTSSGNSWCK